jgi:hypothetical protein
MARVLRNSKGQFQGSTGGWGRGNRNAAGPNTGRSGPHAPRLARGVARNQRLLSVAKKGGSVGLAVGGTVAGAALAHKGAQRGNMTTSLLGIGLTVAGQVGVVASKRTLKRR